MFDFRKNKVIKTKIESFLQITNETIDLYGEGMLHYLEQGIDDHYNTLMKRTHGSESKADDLRREIEWELLGKSLLPESREDIINVIDTMDKIPNRCEKILKRIYTHNIVLPEEFRPKVKELVELGIGCCRPLKEAVMDVLGPCKKIKDISRNIDTDESAADGIETELFYSIFHGDYDPFEKMLYRDAIRWIAGLPDLAEVVTDQLTIIAIKRNV